MTSIVRRITARWSSSGVIEESDGDIYEYGLELILFSMVNLVAIFITAAIMGRLPESIALVLAIIPMQAYGGGYHAKTHLRCFCAMYVGWWVSVYLVLPIFNAYMYMAMVVVGISLLIIFLIAPVAHVNVGMSTGHRLKLRKFVRILALCIAFLSISLIWLLRETQEFGITLSAGLGIASFSMLLAYIKNVIQKRSV